MSYHHSDPSLINHPYSADVEVLKVPKDRDLTNTGFEGLEPGSWYYRFKTQWSSGKIGPMIGPFSSREATIKEFAVEKMRTYVITLTRALKERAFVKISAKSIYDAQYKAEDLYNDGQLEHLDWSLTNDYAEYFETDFQEHTNDEPDYTVEPDEE